ncbi:MAG TPA: hypothetical protein VMM76_27400 [Pirellulaceae bacterium]|nr:hypothetical protein [Pirellulaceae bacterium]
MNCTLDGTSFSIAFDISFSYRWKDAVGGGIHLGWRSRDKLVGGVCRRGGVKYAIGGNRRCGEFERSEGGKYRPTET